MEDQTIEDIDKWKKTTPEKDSDPIDGNPMWLPICNMDNVDNSTKNYEKHGDVDDQHVGRCATLLTIEVEFIIMMEACKEFLWLKKVL